MKSVRRNPKKKKKGGLNAHMLIDAHSQTPTFVKISEAKSHNKNFMPYLNLAPHSMIVFDRESLSTIYQIHPKPNQFCMSIKEKCSL